MNITHKISIEAANIAKALDKHIEDIAGERIGFTLMIYTDDRATYISNCSRELAINELKTLLEYWEADMPDIPAHKIS